MLGPGKSRAEKFIPPLYSMIATVGLVQTAKGPGRSGYSSRTGPVVEASTFLPFHHRHHRAPRFGFLPPPQPGAQSTRKMLLYRACSPA